MNKLKIKTNRLFIRNLKLSDLDNFHRYRCNPEVTQYQGFEVMDKDQCETFIQSQEHQLFGKAGEWVQYGIENISSQQLIGDCAIQLQKDDPRIAEIGITISHFEQRKGFAKEAMLGILSFLFEEKKLHRVKEIVDAENIASVKLLESIGFRREGHFIENIFFKGKWGSEYQYAMLHWEWEKIKSNEKNL